jgi:hypothetical protein
VSTLELIAVPTTGTAGLALVGAAPAAALRQLAADVRAALVLPVGAAIVACSSTLLLLGIPARVIGVTLGAGGALALVAARRHVGVLARGLAVPAAVGLVAFSLASIPALAAHNWDAASSGNGDIYWWVSQSRAFLDGPAPAPAADHPDRAMYERVTEGDEPFGTSFGLSLLSLASGRRPEAVFSAFGALVAAILALTIFAVARTALRWRPVQSAAAAALAASTAQFATWHFVA